MYHIERSEKEEDAMTTRIDLASFFKIGDRLILTRLNNLPVRVSQSYQDERGLTQIVVQNDAGQDVLRADAGELMIYSRRDTTECTRTGQPHAAPRGWDEIGDGPIIVDPDVIEEVRRRHRAADAREGRLPADEFCPKCGVLHGERHTATCPESRSYLDIPPQEA